MTQVRTLAENNIAATKSGEEYNIVLMGSGMRHNIGKNDNKILKFSCELILAYRNGNSIIFVS